MARPLTFDPAAVLPIVARVFYERGFEQTSIAELVEATGASRHSLYTRWGGKDELLLASLEVYAGFVRATVFAPLVPARGRAAVQGFLHAVEVSLVSEPTPACLMVQTLSRPLPESDPARLRAKAHFHELATRVAACLEVAQRRGELEEGACPQGLGELVALTMQGLSVSRYRGLDPARAGAALRALASLI